MRLKTVCSGRPPCAMLATGTDMVYTQPCAFPLCRNCECALGWQRDESQTRYIVCTKCPPHQYTPTHTYRDNHGFKCQPCPSGTVRTLLAALVFDHAVAQSNVVCHLPRCPPPPPPPTHTHTFTHSLTHSHTLINRCRGTMTQAIPPAKRAVLVPTSLEGNASRAPQALSSRSPSRRCATSACQERCRRIHGEAAATAVKHLATPTTRHVLPYTHCLLFNQARATVHALSAVRFPPCISRFAYTPAHRQHPVNASLAAVRIPQNGRVVRGIPLAQEVYYNSHI